MKKLIYILVLSLICSGSALANNIFSVKCTINERKVFNPDRKNVSRSKSDPWFFTFDERKQKIIEVNFKTKKNDNILITDSLIYWHSFDLHDDKRKEFMKKYFNEPNAASHIFIFEINRYSGEFKVANYDLNKFWTNKYLGLTKENLHTYNFDIIETRKFFLRSIEILKKAIKENSNTIPQKDFIHTGAEKGVCNKVEKTRKF